MLPVPLLLGAAPPVGLEVVAEGLRSTQGVLRLCLVQASRDFPDCSASATARRLTVAADTAGAIRFADLPPGDYALALVHDENGNGRLDRMMGIPREGIGFSRNPALRFGPPPFVAARFHFDGQTGREAVRVKYFL